MGGEKGECQDCPDAYLPQVQRKRWPQLLLLLLLLEKKGVATFGQKPDVGEVSGIFVLACLNPNQTGGGQWDVNQPLEKSMLTYINNVLTAHDLRLSGLVF